MDPFFLAVRLQRNSVLGQNLSSVVENMKRLVKFRSYSKQIFLKKKKKKKKKKKPNTT